ncbi:hypothetical protein BHE97_03770 [Aeromicrobium sp. PE09-221]|nr:hypothetical protein BHE97_03770 [Aeromicrobium sp. PE09-221]
MDMYRRLTVAAGVFAALVAVTACDPGSPSPNPTASASSKDDANEDRVESHESGPESPIVYGMVVPRGAVQLGPLARVRSEDLINTYRPDLEAVLAEKAAEEAAEDETDPQDEEAPEQEASPTPTPTPTDVRPERDTFADLEDPPRPDSVISVMRIDEDPTTVTRAMLAQIAALLPDEEIVTDDLSEYCTVQHDRIDHCAVDVTGTTPGDREVRVQLDIDPGDVQTRTGNAFSRERPVMVLEVSYVGDPREGQENTESEQLGDLPSIDTPEESGLIWPKMDVDAPGDGPLIGEWSAPEDDTVLLTGSDPAFALTFSLRSTEGAAVAQGFITDTTGVEEPARDVVADLNEVIAVYTAQAPDGTTARAVHVVSARGNYVFLFAEPPAQ